MKDYVYQHGFSELHPEAVYNVEMRGNKARKTLAVMRDWATQNGCTLAQWRLLDIGCSTGYLTKAYAEEFGEVVGIDIDTSAVNHAQQENPAPNITYQLGDSMDIQFPDNSFDVATCTHIYEHVPDSQRLVDEIYRVLKPGGVCYFAAGNRFVWMEMHYQLPLLAAIPKWLAHLYLRLLKRGTFYYENHLSYWGLKRLTRRFEIVDYTMEVIRDPARFSLVEMVRPGSLKQRLAVTLLPLAYWLCPTYIWLLRKPADQGATAAGSKPA